MKSHHCWVLMCGICKNFSMNWNQKQPGGIPQLRLPIHFSQSLCQQSAGDSSLSLEGMSSIPGIGCSRSGNNPVICHGLIHIGTGGSSWVPAIHSWHQCVGQHSRRFWDREENNPSPFENWLCHKAAHGIWYYYLMLCGVNGLHWLHNGLEQSSRNPGSDHQIAQRLYLFSIFWDITERRSEVCWRGPTV